jgi:hypothetical protein
MREPNTSCHAIIGLVVLACLVAQPVLGLIHHERFRRLQRRQIWSYLHLFNGRIPITLGIVNGALGLWIARASDRLKVAYLATAGAMWYVMSRVLFPPLWVSYAPEIPALFPNCSRNSRCPISGRNN